MGAAVLITRLDLTASELRKAASGEKNSAAARRILALALVLDGMDRKTAAETCGMDRQTLRDWVHRGTGRASQSQIARSRIKAHGAAAGRIGRACRGRPRPRGARGGALAAGRSARRIAAALRCRAPRAFGREGSSQARLPQTVGKAPPPTGGRRRSENFKKTFAATVTAQTPERAKSKPIEIWFQDEARIGQQGTLTRVWAKRGTRPRAPHDQRYDWAYLFGAACPQRRVAAGLVMPAANAETMSLHLTAISRKVAAGSHAALVLDGAGYHLAAALTIPENVTLVRLPPYAPELNPIENVWEYLRGNKLAITVFDDYDDIVDKTCDAWNFFEQDPTRIASITTRTWATVNN